MDDFGRAGTAVLSLEPTQLKLAEQRAKGNERTPRSNSSSSSKQAKLAKLLLLLSGTY